MRYVPWDELKGRPNVIVDGYPTEGTVLTLSHWRGSGSPEELADDLSTQIAFRYLDRPDLKADAEFVSNNHFDEDGLCGTFALIHPEQAQLARDRLIQVASAGDFDTFDDREAARVAFALGTLAAEDRSPLAIFDRPYPQQSAALYEEGLGRLPSMIDNPDQIKNLWEEEDAWLARDEEHLRAGRLTIEERPGVDLAIATLPGDETHTPPLDDDVSVLGAHASAIHNATERHRILAIRGRRYVVRYRYETWVQFVSRPTMPRVDLAPLAEELTSREQGARWMFDDIEALTPSLRLEGNAESALAPEEFTQAVEEYLHRSA
jgi:uncharacterized protein DUF6687